MEGAVTTASSTACKHANAAVGRALNMLGFHPALSFLERCLYT